MEGEVEFRDGALKAALHELGERAEDLTPLMDRIGSHLVGSAQSRISDTNIGPDGVPWPKSFREGAGLYPNLFGVDKKKPSIGGGKTLYASGLLRNSITYAASAREVEIGSNLIYAAIHQFGGTIVPKAAGALTFRLANGQMVSCDKVTIPARPYLGISEEDERFLTDVALNYLAGDADVA